MAVPLRAKSGSSKAETGRAEPPRIPAASPAQVRDEAEQHKQLRQAEGRERRSMVRALVVLVLLVLLLSMAHAGLERVFPNGWWRP